MKFSCTQENLIKGLNIVTHIAGKNISLPILNNILIQAKDGKIVLVSTNLDIGIKTIVRGKIEEDGELTVQARLLNDYIMLLNNKNITLEGRGNDILIKTNEQETVIKGQAADEYPIVPEVEEKSVFEVSNKIFKEALTQVIFSASYDDTRPEISGVLFSIINSQLIMTATDSYRLSEKIIKIETKDIKELITKIIPLKVLQEISRILEETGEIKVFFSDNQIVFKTKETVIISRVIEGNYPDYKQIIPDNYKTKVELEKNELIKLVKAASLFSKTGINDTVIEFEKELIKISAVNNQLGENKSNLEAKIEGEKNRIVFNFKYLLDGLNNIPAKKIALEATSSDTPVVIRPVGEEGFLYLIMPIRQ